MYHPTLTRSLTALVILLAAINSHASLTPVLPSPGSEPSLIGIGGILDDSFGLNNLVCIRQHRCARPHGDLANHR